MSYAWLWMDGARKTTSFKQKIFLQMAWCVNVLHFTVSLDYLSKKLAVAPPFSKPWVTCPDSWPKGDSLEVLSLTGLIPGPLPWHWDGNPVRNISRRLLHRESECGAASENLLNRFGHSLFFQFQPKTFNHWMPVHKVTCMVYYSHSCQKISMSFRFQFNECF